MTTHDDDPLIDPQPDDPVIDVPDLEPPMARLCWAQDPDTLARCDRMQHAATTPHTWQLIARLERLEAAVLADAKQRTARRKARQRARNKR